MRKFTKGTRRLSGTSGWTKKTAGEEEAVRKRSSKTKLTYCAGDFSPVENPRSFSIDDFRFVRRKTGWGMVFVKRTLERMCKDDAVAFLNRRTQPTVLIVSVGRKGDTV
jgi:hypothetical protein